jgi:DNA-binding HxlR family transcriptional regulator
MEEHARQDVEHRPEDCRPVAQILGRVGDKWTGLLLGALGERRMRFKALHRAVGGISQRMLTVTLRNLERDGLLVRTVYPTVPPRVEYELSDRGRSLKAVLQPIGEWVKANQEAIEASRRRFDMQSKTAGAATLTKE